MHIYTSSGNNSLFPVEFGRYHSARIIGRETVDVVTLDDVLQEAQLEPPDVIKVDIEGGELHALVGARETIEKYRPALLLEFCEALCEAAGYRRKDLLRELDQHGYSIYGLAEDADDFNAYARPELDNLEVRHVIALPSGRSAQSPVDLRWRGGGAHFPEITASRDVNTDERSGKDRRLPALPRNLRSMRAVIRARRARHARARVHGLCKLCGSRWAEHVYTKNGVKLVRCTSCGLVYVWNPPTRDAIERQYSFASGYHTEFQSGDSAESHAHAARAADFLRVVKRYSRPGNILDVGCSVGFFLERARAEGWTTFGVEISNDTAELARRRGLDVFTGTLEQADFHPGSFDVVTMWDVVEHLEDPGATISIAAEVLKETGLLALSTPNIGGIFPRLSYGAARWTGRWPHPEPPSHLFQFSKATIRRLLKRSGLAAIEILDRRIPPSYTFGDRSLLLSEPKRLAYAAVFAPVAFVAPLVRGGDDMVVIARKKTV
jgi:2-polyprenyl-3-methyl-5-hydroxy-6-metoxy-1,4-benzoquinol methylase